jgi:hypothetical protein
MGVPLVPAVDNACRLVIAHKKLELDGYTRQLHTQNRKGEIQYEAR